MPVTFHPNNPINALEKIITKENGEPLYGEIDVYRKLYIDLTKSAKTWDIWHNLKLPTHSKTSNLYNKTSAQIDFLILCEYGIIVMEVKGGPVSTKDNIYYYGANFNEEMKQNPFYQVEGYKYTLKDTLLSNFKNCFICDVVAFPHVNYSFESGLINEALLWTEQTSRKYNYSIEQFLLHSIRYSIQKHEVLSRTFKKLNQKEYTSIKNILSPNINKINYRNVNSTLEWLQINNIEILEGLYKNQRIMIEGPPGSGKTTLAKAYIDRQANKEGLYLCWNNLLMHSIKDSLQKRQSNIKVYTLSKFVLDNNPNINHKELFQYNELEFGLKVKETVSYLVNHKKLKTYDYIVIDEAQDLFDRGIEHLIIFFSGYNNKGLINGESLILYDIDQSYMNDNRGVSNWAEYFSNYYAHFKLNDIKRSAQSESIKLFCSNILNEPSIILKDSFKIKYPTIPVFKHRNIKEFKRHVVKSILNKLRLSTSSLEAKDCIILMESKLLNIRYQSENIEDLLMIRDIEELTSNNISNNNNTLKYTTILKYKGLEKKNVYLAICNSTKINSYELFVGATRAILNLEINIIDL